MPTDEETARSQALETASEILSIVDEAEALMVVAGLIELATYSSQYGYRVVSDGGVSWLEDRKSPDVRRCTGLSTFALEAISSAVPGCGA